MTDRNEVTLELDNIKRDLPRTRDIVLDAARDIGFTDSDAWCIVSAVFEACANAVVHGRRGCQGRITLSVRTYDDRLEAIVQDTGAGFTCPAKSPVPPPTSRRGRGIPMMKAFMDEVRFEYDGGCRAVLVKHLTT
ncbi:MAG: anti-sigma regulatory factor [Armatimonadetes bacterium]|nr:anti-sigma regulatory factor [Armatimonadota bacterium]